MSRSSNPWKRLSAKVVYENPWIRVEDHKVINPSGGESQYGKVCFKSRAVAVVATDAQRQIYLVGQFRYTLEQYSWELPMGGAALGEDALAAAQRELSEETGLSAARWEHLFRVHTSNSVTDEGGDVFLASELTEGTPSPGETEQLEVIKLPLELAVERIRDGRITDAMSVAGILYVALAQASGATVSA
jgi:8-oxo-dGTP pyrophosphatase MutT (NUDIX family)